MSHFGGRLIARRRTEKFERFQFCRPRKSRFATSFGTAPVKVECVPQMSCLVVVISCCQSLLGRILVSCAGAAQSIELPMAYCCFNIFDSADQQPKCNHSRHQFVVVEIELKCNVYKAIWWMDESCGTSLGASSY